VQVSELLSTEKRHKAVMDFLAATDARKFLPTTVGGARAGGQWVEKQWPVRNGWRSNGRQAPLDLIPFPLYYIDHFQMLSFHFSDGYDG